MSLSLLETFLSVDVEEIIFKYIVIFIEHNYPAGVSVHNTLDDAIKVLCKRYKVFDATKDEYIRIIPEDFYKYFMLNRDGIWCPKDFYDDSIDTNNAFIKEVEIHGKKIP